MTDLLRVVIRQRKLGGRILYAREIVRNGVSFEAMTYLERAELLFRATKKEGIKRILLLKAHAYWALGWGEEILAIAEETMRFVQVILNRGPRLQEITLLICWTTDAMKKYWFIAILFWLYVAKPMEESTRAKRMPCAQRLCSSSAEMLLLWIRSLQEPLN